MLSSARRINIVRQTLERITTISWKSEQKSQKRTPTEPICPVVRVYLKLENYWVWGLIEWMENTDTLRNVLRSTVGRKRFDQYTSKFRDDFITMQKRTMSNSKLKSNRKPGAIVEKFKQLRNAFPKLMHKWFLKNWPNSEQWFQVRLRYTTSYAVWCILGAILGLGNVVNRLITPVFYFVSRHIGGVRLFFQTQLWEK